MRGAERGKIAAVQGEVFSKTPSLSLRLRFGPSRGNASLFGLCSATVRLLFGLGSAHVRCED